MKNRPALFGAMCLALLVAPKGARAEEKHDGLYLALDVGAGYQNGEFTTEPPLTVSGAGLNLTANALAGVELDGRLAVGGGAFVEVSPSHADSAPDPADPTGSTFMNATVTTLMAGPMLDVFPDHTEPWRLGASLGVAAAGTGFVQSVTKLGPGLAAWVGFAPFVFDHVSIGFTVRLLGTLGFGDNGVEGSTRSLSLLASVAYF